MTKKQNNEKHSILLQIVKISIHIIILWLAKPIKCSVVLYRYNPSDENPLNKR